MLFELLYAPPVTFDKVMLLVGGTVSTSTSVLLALSTPCQLVPIVGVTVYCQVPVGTLFSTHDVVAIVPAHEERMVWSANGITASYRLTT